MNLVQIIQYKYPSANLGLGGDFTITDNGSGPKITFWKEEELGPQPSLADLEAHRAAAETAQSQRKQQEQAETQNRGSLEGALGTALTQNKAFLALSSPTAAQNSAQIKALTRQMSALIRLHLRRLDATD